MGLGRCRFPMCDRLDCCAYRAFNRFNVRFLEGLAHEQHQLVFVNSDRACFCRRDLQIKKKALFGLRQLLGLLDSEEQHIIHLRYFEDCTQMQVAAALGMTQVQVSRAEKRILRKLREAGRT